MKLYSYFQSSSAWRVRIALALKKLPYELVPIHLVRSGGEQHSASFTGMNALAQVPVLEVSTPGGVQRLTQSLAILEYLEETQPEPALLPEDPLLRARARQLAEIVNSGTQPYQNLSLRQLLKKNGVDPLPVVRGYVDRGLVALEAIAKETAGRFLVRDSVSFADILLVPQLYTARRFGADPSRFPTLRRVEEECSTLPEFQSAHPNAQPDFEPER